MRTCVQAYDICFGYRLYACTYERKNIKAFTVIAFEGGVDIMAAPQYAIYEIQGAGDRKDRGS